LDGSEPKSPEPPGLKEGAPEPVDTFDGFQVPNGLGRPPPNIVPTRLLTSSAFSLKLGLVTTVAAVVPGDEAELNLVAGNIPSLVCCNDDRLFSCGEKAGDGEERTGTVAEIDDPVDSTIDTCGTGCFDVVSSVDTNGEIWPLVPSGRQTIVRMSEFTYRL